MKKVLPVLISIIAWLSVLLQYYLTVHNSDLDSLPEIIIRFFGYFTILTNIMVAVVFSLISYNIAHNKQWHKTNSRKLTAVTVYITIVGLVYQVILRFTWEPTGLQKIIDESLHSILPIMVILFWFSVRSDLNSSYKQLYSFLIFPFIYLIYTLIRGNFSGFYPYPFLDVSKIGLNNVLFNSAAMVVLFIAISTFYIWMGKTHQKLEKSKII